MSAITTKLIFIKFWNYLLLIGLLIVSCTEVQDLPPPSQNYEETIDFVTDNLRLVLDNTLTKSNVANFKSLSSDGIKDHFDDTLEEFGYKNYEEPFSNNFDLFKGEQGDDRFDSFLLSFESSLNRADAVDRINNELNNIAVIDETNFEYVLKLEIALVLTDYPDIIDFDQFKAGGWKCGVAIVSGFLSGGLSGALAGAKIGTLVTAPRGAGAAAGATTGAVIGGVVGAVAGGLAGAAVYCDEK